LQKKKYEATTFFDRPQHIDHRDAVGGKRHARGLSIGRSHGANAFDLHLKLSARHCGRSAAGPVLGVRF
jgi:hypothetical protein